MKKIYFSSVALLCLIMGLLSTSSFAQIKPSQDSQQLPDAPTTNIVGGANTTINVVPWQIFDNT